MEHFNKIDDKTALADLYKIRFGTVPDVTKLPGAGSDRRYYRLQATGTPTAIGTCGDDAAENRTFCDLAIAFRNAGCKVPEIYAEDYEMGIYLQKDLGDTSLLDLLFTDKRMDLSRKSLFALVEMQTVPKNKWEDLTAWNPFSIRLAKWDLNYFKYEFLKPASISFDEELLEDDFELLAADLCDMERNVTGFMYRDFQSRNIMIKDGEPYLIDFQGGRLGPVIYDAVSFLWQSKAKFTENERRELLGYYAELLSEKLDIDVPSLLNSVGGFALFRTLQVLGAYGFRGLVEKKAHFIESIPGALDNLKSLSSQGVLSRYPELERVARECIRSRFASVETPEILTVKVFSFSYKKGYPEDLSGNGGGFMFDCRGMHNPGRYICYKSKTGLDSEVIDFLEEKGEVQGFVENAVEMTEPTIARFRTRGFKSLQVGFGCTGGQHRSVYCAQRYAEEISRRFPDIKVELEHREQCIRFSFPK